MVGVSPHMGGYVHVHRHNRAVLDPVPAVRAFPSDDRHVRSERRADLREEGVRQNRHGGGGAMKFDFDGIPESVKDKLGIGADKVYAAMGEFDDPDELVEAGRKIRAMGYTKLDAMTPFPVHGLDKAIGIPYSKLGWIV